MGLESCEKELRWHFLYLLSEALAVLWIQSAIELIHDVEWSSLNLLDGEDEARRDHGLLTARQP
jgi:hypothetical protein